MFDWLRRLPLVLLLCWFPAAANDDPLDPIAVAISELDATVETPLLELRHSVYPNADIPWQLRWHLLRCELATMLGDVTTINQQVTALRSLQSLHPDGPSLYNLCLADSYGEQAQLGQQRQTLQHIIDSPEPGQDPALVAFALLRLGISQSDSVNQQAALANLTRAMELFEQLPQPSHWLHYQPAKLQFALLRLFTYLGNTEASNQAAELALATVRPDSPLEWFIRFNYAAVLNNNGDSQGAFAQLQQLPQKAPIYTARDRGFSEQLRAQIATGAGDYQAALIHNIAAINAFKQADEQDGLASSLVNLGKLKLEQGDAKGWQEFDQGMAIYLSLHRLSRLAEHHRWAASHWAELQQFDQAYSNLLRYLTLRREIMTEDQEEALAAQQKQLGTQLDLQRQRLAAAAEAHYQGQQSLLIWQSYAGALTILLVLFVLVRGSHQIQKRRQRAQEQPVAKQLNQLLQQAKERGRGLGLLLLRINGDEDQLQAPIVLMQQLRPEDRCLKLKPGEILLLMPGASNDELNWRLQSLREWLPSSRYRCGIAQMQQLDDVTSLMTRLEYDLVHRQRQQQSPMAAV